MRTWLWLIVLTLTLAGTGVRAADRAATVEQQMAQMEARLDKLEAQRAQIHRVGDPIERKRLLAEHQRALREAMGTMRAMDKPFNREMRAMMGGTKNAPSAELMMHHHALMMRRITLMDRMMEQFMQAGEAAPTDK